MYSYSRYEQETTITWNAEDRTARIYSADPVTMRKLDKLAEEFPEVYRIVWTEDGGKARKYTVDSALIRFGKPRSEAQAEADKRRAANLPRKRRHSGNLTASAPSVE